MDVTGQLSEESLQFHRVIFRIWSQGGHGERRWKTPQLSSLRVDNAASLRSRCREYNKMSRLKRHQVIKNNKVTIFFKLIWINERRDGGESGLTNVASYHRIWEQPCCL